MSLIVKLGKKGKSILKKLIAPAEAPTLSYTRRIERVCTTRRICAMTFDDGPMDLPASPDRFGGRVLTDVLLDELERLAATAGIGREGHLRRRRRHLGELPRQRGQRGQRRVGRHQIRPLPRHKQG